MTPSRNASCIRVLPAITWLRSYERDRLGSDIVADVTLARISAFRSVGRCVFCQLAARSWSLRLLVQWPVLLGLLRLAVHRRFRYLRHLAGHRHVA
jgi:hypothetical protein